MEIYAGLKFVQAKMMNSTTAKYMGYNIGKTIGDTPGYEVNYFHEGFKFWLSEKIFEQTYHRSDELTFGLAADAMKRGYKIARKSWKDCYIYTARNFEGTLSSFIFMKTGDGTHEWIPSATEIWAEDWYVIDYWTRDSKDNKIDLVSGTPTDDLPF